LAIYCRGLCEQDRWDVVGRATYKKEHKYCSICGVAFINLWKDIKYCPCCGGVLRTKGRDRTRTRVLRSTKERICHYCKSDKTYIRTYPDSEPNKWRRGKSYPQWRKINGMDACYECWKVATTIKNKKNEILREVRILQDKIQVRSLGIDFIEEVIQLLQRETYNVHYVDVTYNPTF